MIYAARVEAEPDFSPPGTEAVAQWARGRRLNFVSRPNQAWFRFWEPYDTMVAAAYYFNAVSWPSPPGSVTLAEPWTEEGPAQPMDRALFGFANHPGLRYRASMRAGEHFITRVTFLASKPPPQTTTGDAVWDAHVTTLAHTPQQARAAFTPALRALLRGWGFHGHIEIRPGGMLVHDARLRPVAAHYEQLAHALPQIVAAALQAG